MKAVLIFIVFVSMAGCASFMPVPENYNGPTATIKDSYSNKQSTTAHFFTLQKIDGNYVSNSFGATRSANYGSGAAFEPEITVREVLPKEQIFTITGYIFFPTDAQLLFGDNLAVRGDLQFSPEAGETYVVKGTVSEKVSEVWLEDSEGDIVGQKFSKTHTE
ncbi:hypothetical protein IFO68_12610 [Photobacterium sp. CAU 1568]|uniref:Lipoprotein n=1 Tax=Photobacterium arenosum TaxID=2774143 RepID=A0ABR9BLT7_9GAMM|nr:hypothetical protein [Photobacterium arenosum]MBD8513513.1 hypothetical protein [Photobacterium arenosum]